VARGLAPEIIRRIHQKGLEVIIMRQAWPSTMLLENHYAEVKKTVDPARFPLIIKSMQTGPVQVMVVRGYNAVGAMRHLLGATNPQTALPGTLRGDLGVDYDDNTCHASATALEASDEIGRWLPLMTCPDAQSAYGVTTPLLCPDQF